MRGDGQYSAHLAGALDAIATGGQAADRPVPPVWDPFRSNRGPQGALGGIAPPAPRDLRRAVQQAWILQQLPWQSRGKLLKEKKKNQSFGARV
jgi:hypothetical protein